MDGASLARQWPDLYQAATNGPAGFRHLVQARVMARSNDREERSAGRWLIPGLSDQFSRVHGGIEKEYYCGNVKGGCLVATDRTVYSILNSPPPELVDVEIDCKIIAREASYGLVGPGLARQLEEATDHAYSGLTRVMVAADTVGDPNATPEETAEAIAAAKAEAEVVKSRVQVLLRRQAALEYFLGVLWGTIPTMLLVALFGAAAAAWWDRVLVPSALVAALAMSALGATISVVQRMASGSLVIDHTASRRQRWILGGLRPAVGAVFGSLAYFTLLTGVLAGGARVGEGAASVATFALTGFAAGFSERFATDMLERAGKLLQSPKQQASGS